MPYIFDEQKKNDQQQDQQATNQTVVSSTNSSSATPTGSAGQQNSGQPAPTSSGQYVNPQKYLDANQSQGFGSQVAGRVNEDINQAKTAQASADQQYKSSVNAAAVRPNQDLITQAATNPTQFRQDPNNVDAFTKQRTANYTGPKTLADNSDLYNAAYNPTQKAVNESAASQTEPGRFALLDQFYNRPTYNRGEKSLDNLLVQNDPNSRDAFAAAQANAAGAKTGFDNLTNDSTNYASQAASDTAAAKQAALAALGLDDKGQLTATGALPDFEKNLQGRVTDKQTAANTAYQNILNGWQNSKSLSPDVVNELGLSKLFPNVDPAMGVRQMGNLYDVDPTSGRYLTAPTQATAANVATPDDYAKAAALAQLGGIDNTFLPENQQGQANTYKTEPTFNNTQFNDDLQNSKANYTREQSALLDAKKQLDQRKADWDAMGPVVNTMFNAPEDFDSAYKSLYAQFKQLADRYNMPNANPAPKPPGSVRT